MSQFPAALALTEEDLKMMLACDVHIGDRNCGIETRDYVFKRRADGVHIIDLRKTWEKIILAARAIVTIENSRDICIVATSTQGATPYAQRASLKLGKHLGAHVIAGRFTPGSFTNYIQAEYYEPRLLLVADPYKDHQSLTEASYVNLPTVALCNTDSPLRHVDIAIPCNNKGRNSIALIMWMIAREVLRLREAIPRDQAWDVMVDMFIQPEVDESAKTEAAPAAAEAEAPQYDAEAVVDTEAVVATETPQ